MRKKSLKVNYLFNLIKTFIDVAFPLITAPYISRVLGSNNLGSVNFALSTVSWFSIFAVYGTKYYGVREISKVKDDKDEMGKVFSELLLIKFVISFIVLIVYISTVMIIPSFRSEKTLFIISGIYIVLTIFNIDWFFQGIEDFKYISTRNFIIKILCLVAIFILVNDKQDYILYAIVSILGLGINNIWNYIYSKKFVELQKTSLRQAFKHVPRLTVLFTSSIVGSIFTVFDKVLLGIMVNPSSVAFYTRGTHIVNIALSITLAMSTVMIPRANHYYHKDYTKYLNLVQSSLNYILFVSLPLMAGIILLSKEIMYILGGAEFVVASDVLNVLAVLIVVNALYEWNYNQMILPLRLEKVDLVIRVVLALASISLNVFLIPRIGYLGAGITIVIVQTLGTTFKIAYVKYKGISFKIINKETIKQVISTIAVVGTVMIVKRCFSNSIIVVLVSGGLAPLVYSIILVFLKDKIILGIIKTIYLNFEFKKYKKANCSTN